MFVFGLIFSIVSTVFAQDFTTNLDMNGFFSSFSENGSCNTSGAATLCRSLPWSPRLHEGVVEKGSAAFVIIDADLVEGTEIHRWSKKFAAEYRAEMVSYFLVNNPVFAQAISVSPYTAVYLVLVKEVNGIYKIKSLGLNIASQIPSEVVNQYNVVQGEIEGTRGEWIPPLKFKMGHQFKLNDAI